MSDIKKETSASSADESKDTNILPEDLRPQQTVGDYLTRLTVEPLLRSSALAYAVRQYCDEGYTGLELVQKVYEWNLEGISPAFSEEDVRVYVQFFMQAHRGDEKADDNKSGGKSRQVYDCLKKDVDLKLFHDQNKTPYAQVRVGGKLINLEIESQDFQSYARRTFYKQTGQSASGPLIEEAIGLLALEALYESEQHVLRVRVSSDDEAQYYDLQNPEGEVIKITADGWDFVPIETVPFTFHHGLSLEQVRPERGGDFRDFLQFLNFATEDEKILFLCTFPVRLIRDVEQAIAYFYGPAGSGKTTLLKMSKDLLDPSIGGISIPVKKQEDVLPLIGKTWVFATDNISKLDNEMSDFLCTLATGGERSFRRLYTNAGVYTFEVKNPAFLTGINVEAANSDLLSRTLLFKTEAIIEGKRLTGKELEEKFQEMKPKLIGGMFDVLSQAIKIRKTMDHKTDFRMADFAMWGAACAEALGIGADRFEGALKRAMKYRAYDAINSKNAGRILLDYLKEHSSFEGTATELLKELKKFRSENDQYDDYERIANSPMGLSKVLRQLENSLLEVGVRIDFENRSAEKRTIKITSKVGGVTNDDSDGSF